jgi:hypothetical protein
MKHPLVPEIPTAREVTAAPPASAPLPKALPESYEPPTLTPVGNLCDLLGKSGLRGDFTYRAPNSGRA